MSQETATVRVTRHFDQPPERVFEAWLDPKTAAKFLFATPTGQMIRAETDPRVGGRFTFTDRRPEMGDVEHAGTYVEIDRPRRLVFDFAVSKYAAAPTRIALDLAPSAAGCDLTLTHDGVLEEYVERTKAGWGMILDGLAKAIVS